MVERARKRARFRHGSEPERVDWSQVELAVEDSQEALLRMNVALEALGISLSTTERSWAFARSWLYRELKKNLAND